MFWNLATLGGAVAGTALGDPRTYGLDAAVGAAFLALLWPRLDSTLNRVVGLLAITLALGLVPITTAGVPVLAAAAVALLAGAAHRAAPMIWVAVLVAALGCYLLKLAGLSVPPGVLEHPLVARVADLLPVALLSALIGVQVFGSGQERRDRRTRASVWRVAFVALLLRAPFIVVVFAAALSAALVRLL